jgi:hypothetical protein
VRSGKPVTGNLSQARGNYAVTLRVPVAIGGTVRYVLTGVVDPTSIEKIVTRQRVPEDWVISVFDATGSAWRARNPTASTSARSRPRACAC